MASRERFDWMCESYLLRHVAGLVAKGDIKGLQEFAAAQASYEEGLTKLSYKKRARLFVMVACEKLRSRGRTREEVLKAEVRDLAVSFGLNITSTAAAHLIPPRISDMQERGCLPLTGP